jgi:parvulin-like peptidyl-prolyl isomerase
MVGVTRSLHPRGRRWRRVALGTGIVCVLAGIGLVARGQSGSWGRTPVAAQPAEQTQPANSGTPAFDTSDYTNRVVAYIYENQPVTRQELGEYLITRYGLSKLPLLVNKKIIENACRARGIEITPAEVEASFQQELDSQKISQADFVKTVLPRYKKNLIEWKEDTLRPRLLMTRLCQTQVTWTEEEIRKAFEAVYGEKLECRMILWPLREKELAARDYNTLQSSEEAFADRAKKQKTSELSAAGGKIKPFGHYTMGDEKLERSAFSLRPGQVSELIETPQGIVLLKCDRRIPPQTSVSYEAVKPRLIQELLDLKINAALGSTFQALRKEANPSEPLLPKTDRIDHSAPIPPPTQVVAWMYGNQPVTREELGEFLIHRYGPENVELLVNHRILERVCQEQKVTVSDEEIDRAVAADLTKLDLDRKRFEEKVLSKWGKSFLEWREDVVRARLLMTKLVQGRVAVTEEDIRKGFEANYGEKIVCRAILWPPDQAKFALLEYPKLRDSEEEFKSKASAQPSPILASKGGELPPIGRYTLGDEKLEKAAFDLQPGQVSILVGTEQGQVMLKCDKRIPPDPTKKIDQLRDSIRAEVFERKVQVEMMSAFKAVYDQANVRLLLKDPNKPEDLAAESKRLMADIPGPVNGVPTAKGLPGS